jgi:hypothetical protein
MTDYFLSLPNRLAEIEAEELAPDGNLTPGFYRFCRSSNDTPSAAVARSRPKTRSQRQRYAKYIRTPNTLNPSRSF